MDIPPGPNFLKFNELNVEVYPKNSAPPPCFRLEDLGLKKATLNALSEKNYKQPTPVQSYVIPAVQAGRDVLACSPTGSGKTAAFLIPIIDKLLKKWQEPDILPGFQNLQIRSGGKKKESCYPQVLIITATRELAIQTLKLCNDLKKNTTIVALPAYGGTKVKGQISDLLSGCGAHILVATPGRLKHFLQEEVINFSETRFLVLDEADKMLSMGFGKDLKFIINHPTMTAKNQRQTLMFSATYPEADLVKIQKAYLGNGLLFKIGELNAPSLDVDENFIEINTKEDVQTKEDKLLQLLWEEEGKHGPQQTLIFVNRIKEAYRLERILNLNDYSVCAVTSLDSQGEREVILRDFREKNFHILISTDLMSRGLNIRDLKHVINYDLPRLMLEYVNRIGRTGRLGNLGKATSFFQAGRMHDDHIAPFLVSCLGHLQKSLPPFLEKYNLRPEVVKAAGRRRRRR